MFISVAHGTFNKTEHRVEHNNKPSLNKYREQIIIYISFNLSKVKVDIVNVIKITKNIQSWKFNNTVGLIKK